MRWIAWVVLVLSVCYVAGCENTPWAYDAPASSGGGGGDTSSASKTAVAHIAPAPGVAASAPHVTGEITFTIVATGVHASGQISGLTPGMHGIHIHQNADLSDPALTSAGPHWNPTQQQHGGPQTPVHHMGDLGNLTADETGHATLDLTFPNATIGDGASTDIVGHSVIIHANPDDLHTDPAGAAGPRIAGGVIEVKTDAISGK